MYRIYFEVLMGNRFSLRKCEVSDRSKWRRASTHDPPDEYFDAVLKKESGMINGMLLSPVVLSLKQGNLKAGLYMD